MRRLTDPTQRGIFHIYHPYRFDDRVETASEAVSVFPRGQRLITNVYIDGFNLYYRALKDTPFRWLDLRKLAEILFPQDTIHRVCYFTARYSTCPSR